MGALGSSVRSPRRPRPTSGPVGFHHFLVIILLGSYIVLLITHRTADVAGFAEAAATRQTRLTHWGESGGTSFVAI